MADNTTQGASAGAAGTPQGSPPASTSKDDDDSSLAVKALQDLVVAVNSLVQTVTGAT